MKKNKIIDAINLIEENYRLVALVDSWDNDKILGVIYLNNKHSLEDFQDAIYKAKEKREDDIYEYGKDWEFISEELDDFDYIETNAELNGDYVEY